MASGEGRAGLQVGAEIERNLGFEGTRYSPSTILLDRRMKGKVGYAPEIRVGAEIGVKTSAVSIQAGGTATVGYEVGGFYEQSDEYEFSSNPSLSDAGRFYLILFDIDQIAKSNPLVMLLWQKLRADNYLYSDIYREGSTGGGVYGGANLSLKGGVGGRVSDGTEFGIAANASANILVEGSLQQVERPLENVIGLRTTLNGNLSAGASLGAGLSGATPLERALPCTFLVGGAGELEAEVDVTTFWRGGVKDSIIIHTKSKRQSGYSASLEAGVETALSVAYQSGSSAEIEAEITIHGTPTALDAILAKGGPFGVFATDQGGQSVMDYVAITRLPDMLTEAVRQERIGSVTSIAYEQFATAIPPDGSKQLSLSGSLIAGLSFDLSYRERRRIPLVRGIISNCREFALERYLVPDGDTAIHQMSEGLGDLFGRVNQPIRGKVDEVFSQVGQSIAAGVNTIVQVTKDMKTGYLNLWNGALQAGTNVSIAAGSWLNDAYRPNSYSLRGSAAPPSRDMAAALAIRGQAQAAQKLKFGIGGFYALEPAGLILSETAMLSITYTDTELTSESITETELSMYLWDTPSAAWKLVGGTCYADSNTVIARIARLGLYTLAAR